MIRRPPRSTLFPYTTPLPISGAGFATSAFAHQIVPMGPFRVEVRAGFGRSLTDIELPPLGALQDRKSTRLNSSHVRISYAVFCLKKKMATCGPAHESIEKNSV